MWLTRAAMAQLAHDHLASNGVPVISAASLAAPTSLDDPGAFGALIARTHNAFDTFAAPADSKPAWSCEPDVLAGNDATWLERAYPAGADRDFMVAWHAAALARIDATDDHGLCHGEVYPRTCRFADDGSIAISELDWVGFGAREYDLATFRWVVDLHSNDGADRLFGAFIDGYATCREPRVTDALTAWVAIRHLWSLRLGLAFGNPSTFARYAADARKWPLEGP